MFNVRILPFSVALFLLIFSSFEAGAQPRAKIAVGYASMSSVATTLWVAQEKGFFAKNGLDVQTIFIPGSPTLIATINTREIHIGYTGGTATLGAAVGGLDLKIVASFGNFVQTDLVVRPDIRTAADLKGKRIGVTSIGGTGWMSAMLGLEQIGLHPERDKISIVAFGDQRVITQALESGSIQGASISRGFSAANSNGPGSIFSAIWKRFRSSVPAPSSRPIISPLINRRCGALCAR